MMNLSAHVYANCLVKVTAFKYYRFEYHQSKFYGIDDAGDLLDNTLDSFPEIEMIRKPVQKRAKLNFCSILIITQYHKQTLITTQV